MIVDEAVGQSIRILKDLERFHISTAGRVQELERLWPQVRRSRLAFSTQKVCLPFPFHNSSYSIMFIFIYQDPLPAKVTDISPVPEIGNKEVSKGIHVYLSIPEELVYLPGISLRSPDISC